MIVSHKLKFIFAAVPKTGTHSVRRALREHMGADDIEQVGLFVQKSFPYAPLARIGHGHLSFAQVRPFLGEEVFASYFKFGFVRNPFDRFVSYCSFTTREEGHFDRNPKAVMREFAIEKPPLDHLLFYPQAAFLADNAGRLQADYVGRVEEMQASYDAICDRLAIPSAQLEQVNTSRRGDYRAYYDQELIDAVARLYKRDIDLFGYSF